MSAFTDLTTRYGSWALITGAAGGIGSEFARQCAAAGFNLVLVDVDKPSLHRLGLQLGTKHRVETRLIVCDLTQTDFMNEIRPITDNLQIGLLINNAGRWDVTEFVNADTAAMDRNLLLNCRAPLLLSHHFGRRMAVGGRGAILFMSSISAYQGTPKLANYAATKAYNRIFAESLWGELKAHNVDVLAVAPGLTKTAGLQRSGMPSKMLGVQYSEPAQVVAAALKNIGRKPVIIPGLTNRITIFLNRIFSRKIAIRISKFVMRQAR